MASMMGMQNHDAERINMEANIKSNQKQQQE
jgi:hypothetical protein